MSIQAERDSEPDDAQLTSELQAYIAAAVTRIQYGQLVLTVHKGRITRMDTTERIAIRTFTPSTQADDDGVG